MKTNKTKLPGIPEAALLHLPVNYRFAETDKLSSTEAPPASRLSKFYPSRFHGTRLSMRKPPVKPVSKIIQY